MKNLDRANCICLLISASEKLNRIPKKSDFTEYEVMKIKSFFGPWPRALEAANLIESNTREKKLEKKIKRKIKQREYKLNSKLKQKEK